MDQVIDVRQQPRDARFPTDVCHRLHASPYRVIRGWRGQRAAQRTQEVFTRSIHAHDVRELVDLGVLTDTVGSPIARYSRSFNGLAAIT